MGNNDEYWEFSALISRGERREFSRRDAEMVFIPISELANMQMTFYEEMWRRVF